MLEAVSYRNGTELSRDRLETAGEPARLVLRPESTEARADRESLLFVLVEFQDAQGRRVPGVQLPLSARVEGAASLLSFASANPLTDENYESGQGTRRARQSSPSPAREWKTPSRSSSSLKERPASF